MKRASGRLGIFIVCLKSQLECDKTATSRGKSFNCREEEARIDQVSVATAECAKENRRVSGRFVCPATCRLIEQLDRCEVH